jgi:hypothetical protein
MALVVVMVLGAIVKSEFPGVLQRVPVTGLGAVLLSLCRGLLLIGKIRGNLECQLHRHLALREVGEVDILMDSAAYDPGHAHFERLLSRLSRSEDAGAGPACPGGRRDVVSEPTALFDVREGYGKEWPTVHLAAIVRQQSGLIDEQALPGAANEAVRANRQHRTVMADVVDARTWTQARQFGIEARHRRRMACPHGCRDIDGNQSPRAKFPRVAVQRGARDRPGRPSRFPSCAGDSGHAIVTQTPPAAGAY